MTPSNYFDHLGRPVPLGSIIAKRGEGIVFNVANDSSLVAKIYDPPKPPDHQAKLMAMLRWQASKELFEVTAWPTATLHERPGAAAGGFLMRRINDFKEVHELYGVQHRRAAFPQADWRFLVHTAMNCAAAFDTVHSCGLVIGDVNHGNLLVLPQGLVVLIDCDSFQVQFNGQTYLCEVGVDEFTPPELQGRNRRGLLRTPSHDRFGLAVLIFRLLFMGRHPFAGRFLGRGDMPLEQAIREFRFAYSRAAQSYQMETPPRALPLAAVSSQMVDLFERAFGPGSAQANARPAASEWVTALKAFLGSLRICASMPGHVYAPHLPNCPWCSLIRQGERDFFDTAGYYRAAASLTGVPFVLATVWARIEQVPRTNAAYPRPVVPPTRPIPWPSGLGVRSRQSPSLQTFCSRHLHRRQASFRL